MTRITRRTAIGLVAAGGALLSLGVAGGHLLRDAMKNLSDTGMMGSATNADMNMYMGLFDRHTEITRTVEEIPTGIRTTTESDAVDLVAQLQAHVSSMYTHLDQRAEVTCMSSSLPTLFRNAASYRRELVFTSTGVVVTETSNDPGLARDDARHDGALRDSQHKRPPVDVGRGRRPRAPDGTRLKYRGKDLKSRPDRGGGPRILLARCGSRAALGVHPPHHRHSRDRAEKHQFHRNRVKGQVRRGCD